MYYWRIKRGYYWRSCMTNNGIRDTDGDLESFDINFNGILLYNRPSRCNLEILGQLSVSRRRVINTRTGAKQIRVTLSNFR